MVLLRINAAIFSVPGHNPVDGLETHQSPYIATLYFLFIRSHSTTGVFVLNAEQVRGLGFPRGLVTE